MSDIDTCFNKKRISTKKRAERKAKWVAKEKGIPYRVYECPVCYWWHLSKAPTRVYKES